MKKSFVILFSVLGISILTAASLFAEETEKQCNTSEPVGTIVKAIPKTMGIVGDATNPATPGGADAITKAVMPVAQGVAGTVDKMVSPIVQVNDGRPDNGD